MSESTSATPKVVVVGSLNVDYFTKVAQLPLPGETVPAGSLRVTYGGKGANQAISAARQGVEVTLLGCVGDDARGSDYLSLLQEEQIDASFIRKKRKASTGSAFITVDAEGENTIVVADGANAMTSSGQVDSASSSLQEASVLVAQFEVPISAVVEALNLANAADVTTVVNPSPLRPTFPFGEVEIEYLIVNELEADEIFGFLPSRVEDHAMLRNVLNELRVGVAIVTRGSRSTLAFGIDETLEIPVLAVLPVDTVGAGDAFAGCFAARIAGGDSLEDALRAGNCAGALTTLGAGAQEPIPDRERVDQHMDQL